MSFQQKRVYSFWRNRIRAAKGMDALNEIVNGLNRQLNRIIQNNADKGLSEQTIIELWDLLKKKRRSYLARTEFFRCGNFSV